MLRRKALTRPRINQVLVYTTSQDKRRVETANQNRREFAAKKVTIHVQIFGKKRVIDVTEVQRYRENGCSIFVTRNRVIEVLPPLSTTDLNSPDGLTFKSY